MAVIIVDRKPLTFVERTYMPQIMSGLKTTFKHMVAPAETLEYPEQRPEIPKNYRGAPTLVKDPNGREKCVSCQLCEFVCPPKAIRITPGEIPEDAPTAHVEYEMGGTLPDQHFKWDKKKTAEEHGSGGH